MAIPSVEELRDNEEKIMQITRKLNLMRSKTNLARRGQISGIDFSTEQKQELIDDYQTAKAECVTLFGELL